MTDAERLDKLEKITKQLIEDVEGLEDVQSAMAHWVGTRVVGRREEKLTEELRLLKDHVKAIDEREFGVEAATNKLMGLVDRLVALVEKRTHTHGWRMLI